MNHEIRLYSLCVYFDNTTSTFEVLTTIMNEYAQPKFVFISKVNSSLKAYQYYLQPSLLSDEIFEGRGIDQTKGLS